MTYSKKIGLQHLSGNVKGRGRIHTTNTLRERPVEGLKRPNLGGW